jgi:hypothetical protein
MAEITKIEKLNGRNYQSWKYNMKLVLMERGLWGFTQPGKETPPEADATTAVKNAFRLRSDKAYSLIALNVEKDIQIHISSVTDPSAAWERLQKQFEFVSVTQIVRLTRKFYAASMDEGADMIQHLTHMTRLAEQLRELKEEISSKKFAMVVLGTLPESYEHFLTSLNARNADDLDWENVKGLLIEESMKRADKSEKQESDNAFFMKRNQGSSQQQHGAEGRGGYFSGRGRGNYNRGGRSQTQFDDQGKHKNVRCFNCNRFGHIMRNCSLDSSRNEGSNLAEHAGNQHEGVALISSTAKQSGEWFIDSAATKHMTNDKSILRNYVEYEQPTKMYLGDDTIIMALGVGNVGLTLCKTADIVLDLHKVLYVPKLTKNLLSVPAMALMGAEIRFDKGKCVVMKNDKEYVIGSLMNDKLYTVNTVEYAQASTATPEPSLEVWHCRLGHLNYDYINQLTKKGMVHGMDYNDTSQYKKQCEACILGKMQRKSFPKQSKHRATRP